MSNQRTSNFKKKTAIDTKQDEDISTLTTTVSNIVVPNWSTQKATTDVDMDSKIIKNCRGLGSVGGDLTLYSTDSNVFCASTFVAPYILSTGNIMTNTTLETNTITPQSGTLTLEGNMTANNLTCGTLNYTTLSPAIPIPSKSLLTYYVDGSCGADGNDGSREKPFRLIQSAINKCEQVWDGTARNVIVAFGSYSENLTISKARIALSGSLCTRYANVACAINGTITLQITDTVDMFNSQVFITGFQIVGSVIDASSSVHTLSIKDCYLYGQENIIQQRTRGAEILNNGVSFDTPKYVSINCRTYLENLTINASNALGTTPLVSLEAGNVEMTSCNIIAKSANTNCIKLTANAYTNTFSQSTFTNDNTGSALKSLFYLYYVLTYIPTINTFTNCGFIFSSTTSKTVNVNNGNNSAIFNDGRDDYYYILNCGFGLRGVSPTVATNYAILPYYNNSANLYISQSGNVASSGTANKISYSGVSVVPFTAIEKALS